MAHKQQHHHYYHRHQLTDWLNTRAHWLNTLSVLPQSSAAAASFYCLPNCIIVDSLYDALVARVAKKLLYSLALALSSSTDACSIPAHWLVVQANIFIYTCVFLDRSSSSSPSIAFDWCNSLHQNHHKQPLVHHQTGNHNYRHQEWHIKKSDNGGLFFLFSFTLSLSLHLVVIGLVIIVVIFIESLVRPLTGGPADDTKKRIHIQ